MMRKNNVFCLLTIFLLSVSVGVAQEPPAKKSGTSSEAKSSTESKKPRISSAATAEEAQQKQQAKSPEQADPKKTLPPTEAKPVKKDEEIVAATIDGEPVMLSEARKAFEEAISQQSRAVAVPENIKEQMWAGNRDQIVKATVNSHILNKEAKTAGIEVTDEYAQAEFNKRLEFHLKRTAQSREQFGEQIQRSTGSTLEEFIKNQVSSETYRLGLLHALYLEHKYPDDFKVTDEEVEKRYQENLVTIWAKDAKVRASHILIKCEENVTEEQEAEARKQAEDLFKLVKAPDADFAAIAKEHSGCPSAAQGGDLNWFGRGRMVPAFEETAFAMNKGDISNVIRTQFGFHIIKLTDKQDAHTIALDEVKDLIANDIRLSKIKEQFNQKVEQITSKYTIEFAELPAITPLTPSTPQASPRIVPVPKEVKTEKVEPKKVEQPINPPKPDPNKPAK